MRSWLLALALLLAPGAAQAEWFEASSAHFVVYADDSERDARKFSEQLERFHAAMAAIAGDGAAVPSPSNRVTVFMVRNAAEVRRIAGAKGSALQGFYLPRAGGSVAFVPRVEVRDGQPDMSMITLLHEYAHHFLITNDPFPDPRWASEGAAEFFSSAEFNDDGSLNIGIPNEIRRREMAYVVDVKVNELLDPELYEKRRGSRYDAFYAKSWALYHYLTLGGERPGQLTAYQRGLSAGNGSRKAAEAAFGDLDQLERDLGRYLRQSRMAGFTFTPDRGEAPSVTLRRLSAGEVAIMPVKIRSRRGVTREQALELVAEAREVATRFPSDAAVLAALAEAEFDAGNDAEAIAAADSALALDPAQVNAYVQKGYALFRRAADAEDQAAAYRAAVQPFLALNKLENDHPLPLVYYFRSFAARGTPPPEQAVFGLERAAALAPFDLGLQFTLATHRIQSGDLAGARGSLVPVAYNPHGGGMAETARRVVERIDAGGEPTALELLELLILAPTEAAGEAASARAE